MAASAVGVIFTNIHEDNVPELVRRRTMASIPFGGRYRLIDFALSNMVNSNISTVGLMIHNNYRSLIDHIGSGKDWDLARKDGGIILLPPFSDRNNTIYTTRLESLHSLQGFFNRRSEKYVVLYDCDSVAKFDIKAIIKAHEKNNADITLTTHFGAIEKNANYLIVESDLTGRVTELQKVEYGKKPIESSVYAGVMVINRQFLLNIVEESMAHGFNSFEKDVLIKQVNSLRIYNYNFEGYYAGIDSMSAYFKHNMELLNKPVRDELFGDRDIYTKVRDSAPSKYGANATVQGSLISDGCVIEGVVENSILFRGVKVEKGAVVRNSILMQDCVISGNTSLNCVIADKNVIINNRQLSGCEDLPYFVQKGARL